MQLRSRQVAPPLVVGVLVFAVNVLWSRREGVIAGPDPWGSGTLEWATPTPPPHGNFTEEPVVYRGPYEYSVPGKAMDFIPQQIS